MDKDHAEQVKQNDGELYLSLLEHFGQPKNSLVEIFKLEIEKWIKKVQDRMSE